MRRINGRRRKPLVQWMPGYGLQNGDAANPDEFASGVEGVLSLNNDAGVIWDAFPLTYDATLDPGDPALEERSLQDLVGGNEWRLRRIVGKFFGSLTREQYTSGTFPSPPIDVAAGFIVCKTDDVGSPQTFFPEVNPMAVAGIDDPWIWRRRWILSPHSAIGAYLAGVTDAYSYATTMAATNWPNTTAGYGSVADGPHIDQKTNRHIHRQERLFFVVAMRYYFSPQGGQTYQGVNLNYLLDYRLLGSIIRSPSGNRRNASR